ncbi:CubicO group peptidase, beta-lactamase class C family [Rhizobiales bacterium GAS113]|nr:CubicO group peptidase, beta-lactamase class C family [Rhizobiales bacterium GAS113]
MWNLPQVDQALSEAAQAKQVPGVVAIAATADEIVYEGAFGRRDLDKPEAMTVDTVFWIASMTKAITCAAAMQLVERNKLSLDEPIAKLLPDLASRPVLASNDPQGEAVLRPAKRPITLRQLMTHTAGFAYDIWNARLAAHMEREGIPGIISCTDKALTTPLSSDPGERWEYGINIDFVGKAIEAVSGQKLDAYFKEHIFEPLGMNDTGFKLGESQRARLVAMHARAEDGSLARIDFEVPQDPEFHMGGGGLYGTARDYIAFTRMLLNGGTLNGNRVLSPGTAKTMGENHIGDLKVLPMKTALPHLSNDVELYPEQEKKWGLSFLINTRTTADGRSPGSLAWAGLANTYFWIDPTRKVSGVILAQLLPFADSTVLKLFGAFERGVYGERGRHKDAA